MVGRWEDPGCATGADWFNTLVDIFEKQHTFLEAVQPYVAHPVPSLFNMYLWMYQENVRAGRSEILSFGDGIQSTALLYLGCKDPSLNLGAAIFADTGWEREGTYANVRRCMAYALERGVPVFAVGVGDIRADTLDPAKKTPTLPFYVNVAKTTDTHPTRVSMLKRQCTNVYKIQPIQKLIRGLTGCHLNAPATEWIGISVDEVQRIKPPRVRYLHFRHPLIEKRWTRRDCVRYLEENGYPVPVRSSCVGCPFHSTPEWASLTEAEYADVVDFETQLRDIGMTHRAKNIKFRDNNVYLHRSLRPMRERPFTVAPTGQQDLFETKDSIWGGGCFL